MSAAIEFLLRLFEQGGPPQVAQEDFDGERGDFLRACQEAGFLSREPGAHPVPSCPHCGEGVPYRLGRRHLCNRCGSTVAPRHLRCWRLDLPAFLRWLASQLHLRGDVRRIDDRTWQLGTHEDPDGFCECFYSRGGPLLEPARSKLAAYRSAVVLYGLSRPGKAEDLPLLNLISLVGILGLGKTLSLTPGNHLLRGRPGVRFDPRTGSVSVGGTPYGEVPVGTKEYYLLLCLSRHLDEFVPYEDIKGFVTKNTRTADTTEEATFCHRLKSRLKTRGWVPEIDLLVVPGRRGTGYRLRGHVSLPRAA